jgi:hypothetical protein|tara:strand:+ start:1718 stop:2857 length:1140 start_codon:yes stop_codon:yes gene_type:complete
MELNKNIKVKEVKLAEPKSNQEIEKELLEKHEEKQQEEIKQTESPVVESKTETPNEDVPVTQKVQEEVKSEFNDNDILSHINERYNKDIKSVDELFQEREEQEPLPEDVSAYLKYKKETGRGFEDYVKLNQNFDELPEDTLLKQYYMATEEGLDEEDVNYMMQDFSYDKEVDEPDVIRRKKLEKKKNIAKAKKFFNTQKENYSRPLESRGEGISQEDKEILANYKQYMADAKTAEEVTNKKRQFFIKKTDEVFNPEFKGFEFKIGEQKLVYSPGSADEVKKQQLTPNTFLSKHLDENGMIKNASNYHMALSAAMNPQKFAEFFYEQGKSAAAEDVMRKTKNIKMTTRNTPEVTSKGGMKIKSLSQSSGRGLRIKSFKKS